MAFHKDRRAESAFSMSSRLRLYGPRPAHRSHGVRLQGSRGTEEEEGFRPLEEMGCCPWL